MVCMEVGLRMLFSGGEMGVTEDRESHRQGLHSKSLSGKGCGNISCGSHVAMWNAAREDHLERQWEPLYVSGVEELIRPSTMTREATDLPLYVPQLTTDTQ